MSALRRLARFLANEPVLVIAGAVQSALVWLFTYVVTDWSPSGHSLDLAGIATGAAVLISMVARQFVTPTEKTSPLAVAKPTPLADPDPGPAK